MESSSSLVNILVMLTGIRKNYTHSYLKNKLKWILSLQRKESRSCFYRHTKSQHPTTSFLLEECSCEWLPAQTPADSCKASKSIQMLPTSIMLSAVPNLQCDLNTACWRRRENTWPQITLNLFLWQSSATLAWGSSSILSKRWALLNSGVCKAISQCSYVHVLWPGTWHTPCDAATECPFRCNIWSNSKHKQSGFSGKELPKKNSKKH